MTRATHEHRAPSRGRGHTRTALGNARTIWTTPGTRRTWSDAAQWIHHADALHHGRISAKVHRDRTSHSAALVDDFIHTRSCAELRELAIAVKGYHNGRYPRGLRAGTRTTTRINNALARSGGPPRWRPQHRHDTDAFRSHAISRPSTPTKRLQSLDGT